MRVEEVSKEICNMTPNTPSTSQPKGVLSINSKVLGVETDNESRPLRRVKGNCSICVSNVMS